MGNGSGADATLAAHRSYDRFPHHPAVAPTGVATAEVDTMQTFAVATGGQITLIKQMCAERLVERQPPGRADRYRPTTLDPA